MSMKTFQISFFCALALLLGACDDEVSQPSLGEEQGSSSVGSLVDKRDGQTYRTVTIGSQIWMAENLNYATSGSYCYNDDTTYCSKYGRLYKWAAAVGKSQADCGPGNSCVLPSGDVQGVCPDGWHLPSTDDWAVLELTAGGWYKSGHALKSTSGWSVRNGSDQFSFSALSAGERSRDGKYSGLGSSSTFWTSTELGDSHAYLVELYITGYAIVGGGYVIDDDEISITDPSKGLENSKDFAFSVRCVKDNGKHVSIASLKGKSSTFTDSRDGQVYKTVQIGKQTWMAQNLNYKIDSSFCTNGDENSCVKYGRLYTWNAALLACPSGWHLPSDSEWLSLLASLVSTDDLNCNQLAEVLISISGWKDGAGYDLLGFSALPAGVCRVINEEDLNYNGEEVSYWGEGDEAKFWSSTEKDSVWAYSIYLDRDRVGPRQTDKNDGFSVRCLKD